MPEAQQAAAMRRPTFQRRRFRFVLGTTTVGGSVDMARTPQGMVDNLIISAKEKEGNGTR